MQCPKCNYKLVLLSNRRNYKCALCSNLYPQKFIENKEFKEWNKLQRQQGIINLKIKRKQELKQIRDIKRSLRHLFNGLPKTSKKEYLRQKSKEYQQRNKEKVRQKAREYYYKNREKGIENNQKWVEANPERILENNRKWLAKNKEKRNKFLKVYIIKNKSLMQQKTRLSIQRKKQKALADEYLKFNQYNSSTIKFQEFVPTYALCDLLTNQ